MPVLKQSGSRLAIKEAVVLDLGDLGRQAAQLRLAAEAKAAKIIGEAEKEAGQLVATASGRGFDQGVREGYDEGYKKGCEQGRVEAQSQMAEHLEKLQLAFSAGLQSWEADRARLERQARQAVLDFSLKLAGKIVHRVIEVDREVIVNQVAQALSLVLQPMDVSVKINPADRPLLEEVAPRLTAELINIRHVNLVDDDQVCPGGCLVQYGQGQIDATITTQMQRVVELMLPWEGSLVPSQPDTADIGRKSDFEDSARSSRA